MRMKKIFYFVSLLLLSLASSSGFAGESEELPSWKANYKNPNFFESNHVDQDILNIDPFSSEVNGYLIEIHKETDDINLSQIVSDFSQYAVNHELSLQTITSGSTSLVYFLEKSQTVDQRLYYQQFGELVTWFLLNRQGGRVSIRPILEDKSNLSFDPDRAIWMESVQVRKVALSVKDPAQAIIDGFHIHVDYLPGQEEPANRLFNAFKQFIVDKEIIYSALDTYPEKSNGPHVRAGWEIKFEKMGAQVMDHFGISLAWLVLNHGEIPIYSHAKTWIYGENEERLISHLDYSLYMGVPPKLDQWFFFSPENTQSGLYRWDAQLPLVKTVTREESLKKQQEVLSFWFGDQEEDYSMEKSKLWFAKQSSSGHSNLDHLITEKFQKDLVLALLGAYDDWKSTPKGRLALLILFDQFPRNMYRGTLLAFSYDKIAREIAKGGIQLGDDQQLSLAERLFFYLPLEHSENIEDQIRSTELMGQLKDDAPSHLKDIFDVHGQMAEIHQKSIEQFGRFPWRNKTLGRPSTPGEEAYLSSPDHHF